MDGQGNKVSGSKKDGNGYLSETFDYLCDRTMPENKPEIITGLSIGISVVCLVLDFFIILFFRKHIEITDDAVISNIMLRLPEYTDVFLAVYVAIIVALLTITITMYVFLKSALDRVIDENQYSANVATIYQEKSSQKLFKIAIFNIVPIIISVLWHLILQFQDVHLYMAVFTGLIAGLICLIAVIISTGIFWRKCINVRDQLKEIIREEILKCREEIKEILEEKEAESDQTRTKDKILSMIGYWSEWDTDSCDDELVENTEGGLCDRLQKNLREAMTTAGETLCKELAVDQYINLFARIEDLMLAGGQQSEDGRVTENDIVTIVQDRSSILDPIIGKKDEFTGIESKDLKDKYYEDNHRYRGEVNSYIQAFRAEVGYDNDSDDNTEFYQSTEQLYKILRRYRNLKISERQDASQQSKKVIKEDAVDKADLDMAVGLYYFLLRVLAVFVSSIHIEDFTFNGNSLNFANFYNSALENVNLYSAQFYHTVFARTRLVQDVLDLSQFDNIYFFNTRIANTSVNNATYDHVMFESVQASHSGFNISIFSMCDFIKSTFKDCFFNDSLFKGCVFKDTSFDGSSMINNTLENSGETDCSFEGCSFAEARIEGWKLKTRSKRLNMRFSDFDNAAIEETQFANTDFNNSNFSNASLVNVEFQNCNLEGALFSEAQLPESIFKDCSASEINSDQQGSLKRSAFKNANLFGAEFHKCDLEKSTFYMANAANSVFEDCELAYGDCSEITLREAKLEKTNYEWALLYNATLGWADIMDCSFKNTIADHLQFTYAICKNTHFDYSTMSESNISGTKYAACTFIGTGMTGNVAYGTEFNECEFIQTDISDTRFLNVKFNGGTYRNVRFMNCSFEESEFINIVFENCELSGAMFTSCSFESLTIKNCTLTSGNVTKIINNRAFKALCHVTKKGTVKVLNTR